MQAICTNRKVGVFEKMMLVTVFTCLFFGCHHTTESVKYTVDFHSKENGSLFAQFEDGGKLNTGIAVEHNKIITFTAKPDANYEIEKWTVTPAIALIEGGTYGSTTARVKITANTSVVVQFKSVESKIILCFDDYSPTWEKIINRYENCYFSFFFCVDPDADSVRADVLKKINKNKHTIGNHSLDHEHLPSVPINKRELYLKEHIITLNEKLAAYGCKPDCFAWPFGAFDRDWEVRLFPHFRKLRRFGTSNNQPFIYTVKDYNDARFLGSSSIDNCRFSSDEAFKDYVHKMIKKLKQTRSVVVLTTHEILDDADWAISLMRLDYLIEYALKHGIVFEGM